MPPITRFFFLAVLTLVLAFYFKSSSSRQVQSTFSVLQNHFQDPQANPYVTPSFSRKIVAIGDLHGDLPNALKVLQMAHAVDAQGNWSGEIDVLVQTGDIIDR